MGLKTGAVKLSKLRELMEVVQIGGIKGKGIQALIINSEDAHQSEYILKRDERRGFISGFKGSLGTAIITAKEAAMFTDGRYFVQASQELDPKDSWKLMIEGAPSTPTSIEWLISVLPANSTVGADPNILSYTVWAHMHKALTAAGHRLMPLDENLVDRVWGEDRPAFSLNPIVAHPLIYTGQKSSEKISQCRREMEKNRTNILVIAELDEVAYLMNLRGSDIPYNPVFFAYVVLTQDEVHFFVDQSRITPEADKQMKDEGVDVIYHPYEQLRPYLRQLSNNNESLRVWISNQSSYGLHADCEKLSKHTAVTPVKMMKAVKNEVETNGMKAAHIRDAVALVKYFAWLEDMIVNKREKVTEISGAQRLEKFRQEQDKYVGLSFTTISSVGAHGAIIHYEPSPETDATITDKELYLCDSGAQFYDGTTDVTRTLHFGEPTDFQRECFTRVFKGMCSMSTAVFRAHIKGNYLDTLARKSLWEVGLEYLHGTGHGVGSYLNVHEGPVGISWRPYPDDPGLEPNMFLSNEPGYYEDGSFGIRLENIECVVKTATKYNRRNIDFLTFETVTLVPIQTSLLDRSLLTDFEISYLNSYHTKCLEVLRPLLQGQENLQALRWLEKETQHLTG
ncbi:xaa-Pro aminopeptidase ApepP-like [Venturia canescens]|uniref:xaa-Pro aminopeptidase ApepP-like n=1 Tax=Venturia canescens TaxID=32260 RepID=UPI001C9BFF33|nr:xaa-Pro aminopeptidase ApepP-like [Venturia canescens]